MIGEAEKRERKEIDFDTFFTDKGLRSLGRMIRCISVSAVDLKTGNAIHVNPRDRYHPASTYKLVIALIICDLVEEGKLRLKDVQRFNHREDYEGGTGILQGRIKEGDPHQIKDLLRLSMVYSVMIEWAEAAAPYYAMNQIGEKLMLAQVRKYLVPVSENQQP